MTNLSTSHGNRSNAKTRTPNSLAPRAGGFLESLEPRRMLASAPIGGSILFVDHDVLEAGGSLRALPGTEIVFLDGQRDGIEQVSSALAGRRGLDSIQFASHGSSGRFGLGASSIDALALHDLAGTIAGWGDALAENGDILLWGCDVASDTAGRAFVRDLASITRADVAASFNSTGNRFAGGDWVLEHRVGVVPSQLASPFLPSYSYTLGTPNASPMIAGTTAFQSVTDVNTINPFTGVTVTDTDGDTLAISVTLDDAAKGIFTPASLTASGFVSAGGGVYTFSGSAGAASAALALLVFDPTDNRVTPNGTELTTFTIGADDGLSTPASDNTASVFSVSVNDAPTIGGVSALVAVADTGTVRPFPNVTFADADNPAQTLAISITLDTAAKGVFTPASLAASGFVDATGGVYTFSGTASAAQTAIRQLYFDPTDNRVAPGTTEITNFTISVDDGIAAAVTDNQTNVYSVSVNDAPTIGGASAGQATNDTANVSLFSAVTIADADSPAQTLSVSVTLDDAAKGVFTSASLMASGFTDAGGGVYTRTGTAAALQTAIRMLDFNPTNNRVAPSSTETTTFTISVSDSLATPATNNTTTVVSTSVNDAPTIGGSSAGQAVNENATVTPFSAVTIGDVDNPAQTLSVSVTLDTAAKGVFTSASLTASGFVSAGGGVYTFSGTAADAQTGIRLLAFDATDNRVDTGMTETTTFTISVNDGVAMAVTDNTTTVISTAVNDAPTIGGVSAGQMTNDTANISPFSAVTIEDADTPGQMLAVSVTLDTAAKGVFTAASLMASGFTDAGGGVYTLTDTPANVQTAIRQLVFNPTDNRVAPGSTETTTFTISADDGVAAATTDNTTTVLSAGVNDAPTIGGASAGQAVNDSATVTLFSAVTIADVDPSQTLSVSVSLDSAAKGVFTTASLMASGFVDAGSGVYTFSGTAGAAQTAIRLLAFDPANDRVAVGMTETTTFTISVDDAIAAPATNNTTTVVSTSVNDAPTIGGVSAGQTTDDTANVSPFSAVTIGDPDAPAQTMTVSVTLDTAAKGVFTPASLAASGFTDAGGGAYTFSGTAADTQTAIRQLVFNPANDRVAVGMTETTTFTISVDDGVAAATTDNTTTVVSTSINDAPTIGATSAGQAVNDNANVSLFSAVTIADSDSPAQTLTVSVTLDDAAKGVFTAASLMASGFVDATGGVYTFSGTAAAAQTAIRMLAFDATNNRVAVGMTETTTFTISVNDGVAMAATDNTTTVISTSINDAPTIGGTSAGQAVTDITTVTPFTAVTIADVDPTQTVSVSVTLDTAAKGVFTPGSLTASGFVSAGGGVYTFSGTPAAAQSAIRLLAFDPSDNRVTPGMTETTTFTISVDDGVAMAVTDNTTTAISTSVNDAPTIGGTTAGQAVTDVTTVSPFTAVTFSDADSPAQTVAITVTLDTAAKGVFTAGSLAASGFVDAGGGAYTFSGTAAASQAAIRQLVFDPADNRVAPGATETTTFTISVDDGVATAVTNNSTTAVSASVNDAPTIGGAVGGQGVNDNATVLPFSGLTVGDVDNPAQTLSITVVLDSAAKGVFTAGSLTASGFVDAGSGVYTFSGAAAAAQTAIRQLVFDPTDNRVAPGSSETTTFTVSANDGVAPSTTNNTTTVVSVSLNDAPTIGGTVAGQAVNDTATLTPFASITVTDPDSPAQTQVVTITLDTAAKGVFTSASLMAAGFMDAGGGVYTFSGTAANAQSGMRQLVFNPADNRVDLGMTETTTFTISVDDSVAMAATDSTTTVVSTSVNDLPVIGGTVGGQATNDTANASPFTAVTIADPDSPAQTMTVSVTLDAAAKGVFTTASLMASGFTDAGGGAYTFSGTAAASQTAIRLLAFDPANDRAAVGMTETTTFTISVNDGVGTAVTDNASTVVSTSVNDAPTIGGSSAGQAVNENATVSLFSAVTITDVDPSQTVSVSVTLDDADKGVFTSASLTASGFTDAGMGVYTFSGTAADAQTGIRQLVFNPANDRVASGMTETTTFTISVNDGVAMAVTDTTTTAVSTAIDENPTVTGTTAGQAVNDTATLLPFSGATITDDGSSSTAIDVVVSLDDAAKGAFTAASLMASGFLDAGSGIYIFSGTGAAATTAIRQLVFQPSANRVDVGMTETTTFSILMTDAGLHAGLDSTSTVVSTSINDAPTLGGAVAGQTVDDNSTNTPFAAFTIAEVDPSQTVSVSVSLDSASKGAFTAGSLMASGFVDAGSGVYTLSGMSAAAAQAAIRQLVFNPADNRVAVGMSETTTFTVSVDDGVATAVTDNTTTAVSTSINDAPTIGGAVAGQTVDDNATNTPFAAFTIADVDPSQDVSISISLDDAAKGAFTAGSLMASGFIDAGSGVYTLSGMSAAAAQAAIRQLVFNPADNRVVVGMTETTTFTVSVDDGVATAVTDNTTTSVSTSINDAPTLGGAVAGQTVNDNATNTPFAAFTIAEVDPSQTVTVSVTIDTAAKGVFTAGSLTASGFVDAGAGVYTLTGMSASAAQAAIRQLVFNPADNRVAPGMTETATFTVSVDDGVATAVTNNTTTTVSTSVNDAPTIGGAAAGQAVNDSSTVMPFANVTITDVDPSQNVSVTVAIDNAARGVFTPASLTASGFVNASMGVYTFSGSAAAAQAAIRQLVFNPADNRVNPGMTEQSGFAITVTDGVAVTADVSTTVVSTSVNDAPTIGGAVAGQAVNDTSSVTPFATFVIADADAAQTVSVTVTLDTAAKGVFTAASLSASGFALSSPGVYQFMGTASAAQTAIRQLAFDPTNFRVAPGMTETTTFAVSVSDSLATPATSNTTTVVSTGTNSTPTLTTVSILTGATARVAHSISYTTLFAAANAADDNTSDTLSFRIEDILNGTVTKNGTPVTQGVTTIGPGESIVWTSGADSSGTTDAFTVRAFDGTTASASEVTVRVSVTALDPNTAAEDAPVSASSNSSGTVSIVTRNDAGDTVLLQQSTPGADWTSINLSDAGVPVVTGGTASFVDPATGQGHATVVTDSGLFLLSDAGNGQWTSRNLTDELGGPAIVGELSNLTTNEGLNVVAGRTASGDFVIYHQTGGMNGQGDAAWTAVNIYDLLRNQGEATPTFTSPIISYVTSWNGLNFGALDSFGNIWTVWTGGGINEWHSTNLSAITGAPTLVGGVTAYTTPWGGINLAGVDTNGDLSITWWVPQFEGNWVNTNFSELFGGPALRPGSVTSYVTSWNALNIAGVDEEGEIIQYWWVPPSSPDQDFWRVTPLTTDLSDSLRRPSAGMLTGIATADSRLNLIGTSEDGHIVRLWWSPTSQWMLEDLTELV